MEQLKKYSTNSYNVGSDLCNCWQWHVPAAQTERELQVKFKNSVFDES